MIKLIATDLDNTLLNDQHEISPRNLHALDQALKKGIRLAVVTGRGYDSVKKIIATLPSHHYFEDNYMVLLNGALVYDIQQDKKIYDFPIGDTLLKKVHHAVTAGQYDIDIQAYGNKVFYVENPSKRVETYAAINKMTPVVVENICMDIPEPIYKILLNGDPQHLATLRPHLEAETVNDANMFFSQPNYLELVHQQTNKGIALAHIAEKLHIAREEVFAMGDNQNDLSMLAWAGLSACPKNAEQSVLKLANYTTESDSNHDAVAEALEKYVF